MFKAYALATSAASWPSQGIENKTLPSRVKSQLYSEIERASSICRNILWASALSSPASKRRLMPFFVGILILSFNSNRVKGHDITPESSNLKWFVAVPSEI